MTLLLMLERLRGVPRPLVFTLAFAIAVVIGMADYLTGEHLSLYLLYVPVIVAMTWTFGFRVGLFFSVFCATFWLVDDWIIEHKPLVQPGFFKWWETAVRIALFVVLAYFLTVIRSAFRQEQTLARVDFLTDLFNSKGFFEAAQRELMRTRRYPAPITAMFMDCDNFKKVNDERGHRGGDELLRQIADVLRSHTRSSDIVGRMGGDEFAVILPQTGMAEARAAVGKLHSLLEAMVKEKGYPVTFSIGVAQFDKPPTSVDLMIAMADNLMYEVKGDQKDGVKYLSAHDEAVVT